MYADFKWGCGIREKERSSIAIEKEGGKKKTKTLERNITTQPRKSPPVKTELGTNHRKRGGRVGGEKRSFALRLTCIRGNIQMKRELPRSIAIDGALLLILDEFIYGRSKNCVSEEKGF